MPHKPGCKWIAEQSRLLQNSQQSPDGSQNAFTIGRTMGPSESIQLSALDSQENYDPFAQQ